MDKTMQTLTIEGREFRVEKVEHASGLTSYLLHGSRGAVYGAMRNVKNPSLLFVYNTRGHSPMRRDVWLTDADGTLSVR